MRTTGLIRWGYLINPVSGTTVGSPLRTGSYAGKSPAYVWDGTGNAGQASDGRYLITLWAADASNNRTQRQFAVIVDTRPAAASVGVGAGWLSPDGDGRRDTAPITWTADERLTGVTRVYNASGTPVRTWRFSGLTTWGTTWTGKDDLGRIVPDGRYVARLDGRDRAGNRTIVDRTINVDRTIRSVRWSASAFDPRARQSSRVTYTLSRRATVNWRSTGARCSSDKCRSAGSCSPGRTGGRGPASPRPVPTWRLAHTGPWSSRRAGSVRRPTRDR